MKALRAFFMEDWLEAHRSTARFNFGESGARPRTLEELCVGSGHRPEEISSHLLKTSLSDSPNWGRRDLRELVARMHPGANVENVLITTGTSEALFLLFRALAPKKVALALPAFQLLYEVPAALGAQVVPLPLHLSALRFEARIEEWTAVLRKSRPDVLVLNSPHNPTGLVFDESFVSALASVCDELGITIIGDEHYRFLSNATPLGSTVSQNNSRRFVTGSFIKCLGCPGLRIGWCVGSPDVLSRMQNEKNYTTHTVNPLSELIAVMVLSNLDAPLFHEARDEWTQNKLTIARFLNETRGVYGAVPDGGLVTALFLKKQIATEAFEALNQLLLSNGIFLLPLSSMEANEYAVLGPQGPLTQGFRLGLGAHPMLFAQGLLLLSQILNKELTQ